MKTAAAIIYPTILDVTGEWDDYLQQDTGVKKMSGDELADIRQEMLAVGREMVLSGLVIATWGNISCRTTGGCLVTPSGMAYGELQPEDLVLVGGDGQILPGQRRPSSELQLHRRIYDARPDVGAVVHTHSPAACSFAVARQGIPVILEEMAQLIGGSVEVAEYAPPGGEELAANAIKTLGQRNGVLLANHGLVAVGRSLAEAMTIAQLAEKAAQVMLGAKTLGRVWTISPEDTESLRRSFLAGYGQKSGCGD